MTVRSSRCQRASTGPRCFQRGMMMVIDNSAPGIAGFNGAALFPTRNARRGERDCRGCRRFNGAALFPTRNEPGFPRASSPPLCFNGAALFPTRNGLAAELALAQGRASTGPRCFQRGMISRERSVRDRKSEVGASTGPRCFQRGMSPSASSSPGTARLQRGRVVSNAECNHARPGVAMNSRFNGAALFPTRNATRAHQERSNSSGFNGGRVVSNAEC